MVRSTVRRNTVRYGRSVGLTSAKCDVQCENRSRNVLCIVRPNGTELRTGTELSVPYSMEFGSRVVCTNTDLYDKSIFQMKSLYSCACGRYRVNVCSRDRVNQTGCFGQIPSKGFSIVSLSVYARMTL